MAWDNPPDLTPGTVTEIWASPDLQSWTLKTNVPGDRVTLPAELPAEFFKARNRDAAGSVSDWSR